MLGDAAASPALTALVVGKGVGRKNSRKRAQRKRDQKKGKKDRNIALLTFSRRGEAMEKKDRKIALFVCQWHKGRRKNVSHVKTCSLQ